MTDLVLRALTEDSMFRVVVAETTATAKGILALQQAKGTAKEHLANLVTSSVLFRETMSPNLRVQWHLRAPDDKGSLLADAHPSGATRGLLQLGKGQTDLDLERGSTLQVMRTLPNGQINQGIVQLDGDAGIADAFMLYMQRSEQIQSVIALGARFDDGTLVKAGGFVVQLLPDLNRAHLAIMIERLRDFEMLREQLQDEKFDASWLLSELLWGMPHTQTGSSDVRSECWCSEVRVMGALTSLGRDEISQLAKSSELLEIDCDYCRHHYEIAPSRLQGLLDQS